MSELASEKAAAATEVAEIDADMAKAKGSLAASVARSYAFPEFVIHGVNGSGKRIADYCPDWP